jgi:hypothetical protein
LALHDVGPVYARGNDFHQDFALARRGYRRARRNQDFRPAGSRMAMHVIDFGKWFFDMNTPCFKFPLRFGPAELLRRRPV